MRKNLFIIFGATLLICAFVLIGCGSNITKISSILNQPDNYMNKTVEIAGVVSKTYGIDLVITEAGAYQVDDGTGKIWVTARNGVPSEGANIWVKGNVAGGVKLMGQNFGTVIHEKERKTKD